MKNLKNCLLLLLAVGVFVSSCKKDEEPTLTELLTIEGGWLYDSDSNNSAELVEDLVQLNLLTLPEADRTPENEALIREVTNLGFDFETDPCEEDDSLIFNEDKTITELLGAVKCESNEPDEESGGTWALSGDESQLIISDSIDEVLTYFIRSINSSRLVLEVRYSMAELAGEEGFLDLSDLENIEGYQDFINSTLTFTLNLKAN